MQELLQEIVSSRGVDVRVDSHRGVIRGVKLLGLDSRNGRRYLPAALKRAAALYEGAKVNVNHPKGSPLAARDYQDRLGAIRNVRVAGEGLFGDLHYNPKHALAEQLAWDAEHAPENVGFSHNVEARTSRSAGQTVVEAIVKVQSVDLVADPATTRGLYESAGAGPAAAERLPEVLSELSLQALRAARPDLVSAIETASAAQVAALREHCDWLNTRKADRQRRATVCGLLREFGLPDLDASDPVARHLAGGSFLEALLAAPDEPAMRRIVQERAELIAAARQLDRAAGRSARPTAREQHRTDAIERPRDARAFAQSIL